MSASTWPTSEDGTDVKRALIEARLSAFEGWKTD